VERSAKEALVGEMKEMFTSVSAAVLVNYQGLSANDLVELRKKLNENSSKMRVVKNTLAKIAAEGTPFEEIASQLVDARALVVSYEDPVGQAKVLLDFAKEHDALKVYGGLLSTSGRVSVLSEKEIEALAKLPSKEELIVKLLFILQSPAIQIVRTLNEIPAKFVRVLSAIAESKN